MEQAKIRIENEYQEQIDSLTKKHQRELLQRPSAKADSSTPQNFEREEMSRQIQMLSQHLESSKKMQDSLMDTMKAKEQQNSPEKN